jgi:hypothetical protein
MRNSLICSIANHFGRTYSGSNLSNSSIIRYIVGMPAVLCASCFDWLRGGPRRRETSHAAARAPTWLSCILCHICPSDGVSCLYPTGRARLTRTSCPSTPSATMFQIVWIVSVIKRWILCKKSYLSDWFHPSTQLLIQSIAAILTVFRFNRDRSFYVWISTSCYDITTLAKKKLQDSVNISAFFVVSPTDAQYFNV